MTTHRFQTWGLALVLCNAAALLHGQTALSVIGTTPTQALVSYQAPDAETVCTLEVSEKEDFSVLAHDVNPTLFPGSNEDTRAAIRQGTLRIIAVGSRRSDPSSGRFYSRALRTFTRHWVRVTCGANSAATDFMTTEAAGLTPETLPFHPQADGNNAFPDFDWSDRSKPVIDPQSGVPIYRISDPRDFSSNTEHSFNSAAIFGGIGWSSLNNINSGTTGTLATTSGTSAVFLAIDSQAANTYGGWGLASTLSHPITDMAMRMYGRGTDSEPVNREISMCLTVNSGGACYGKTFTVTLPLGTAADLGVQPIAYPNPIFTNWEKVVTRDFFTSKGRVTAVNGVVTLTKDAGGGNINGNFQSTNSRFQQEWQFGAKIFIANSSPTCPNNYCTLSSVQSQTQLTVLESVTTASEQQYAFAGLGFLIWKNTSTGSISLSARYRLAKSFVMHNGAGAGCSGKPVETSVDRLGQPLPDGRTIKGYLCVFPWMREAGGRLYFVGSSEPDVRFLSLFKQPSSLPDHINADLPNAVGEIAGPTGQNFDPEDPNVMYTGLQTRGGSFSVFKLTYQGDYRENTAVFWASNNDSNPATGTANITWENVMKSAEGKDLRSQVLAKTSYKEAEWGNLASRINFFGFAEGYASFFTSPVGGSETPCWVFTVSSKTGELTLGWNTLNGGGPGTLAGGCHAVQVQAGRIFLSNNGLRNSNVNSQWGGPFEAPVVGVLRSGSFTTQVALPGTFDNTYDNSCPADLADQWKERGAVGNQCVTVKIAGEPCSNFSTTLERQVTPCPQDVTKSWVGAPVGEGQQFYDGNRFFDDEHLMVVRRLDVSDGIVLTLLRDAAPGYCCQSGNSRGRICLASPGQAVHSEGWKLRMVPAGSCGSASQLYDPSSGTSLVEDPNLIRGHFSYQRLNSGNHIYAGVGSVGAGYLARYDATPGQFGKLYNATFAQWPRFGGASSALASSIQSYIALGGRDADTFQRKFAADWRHPNGSIGVDVEAFNQLIGSPYTVTLESGTSSVYRVSAINGGYDAKRTPLIAWAGRYALMEVSSTIQANTLTDATPWRMCYAYRAGECREGSTAGSLYVVVPGLETGLIQCHASQISYRSLCVFAGNSIFGQVTQVRIDQNDPAGLWQRRLGYSLSRPGSQYVYSKATPTPNGMGMFSTAWNLQGVYSVPVYMALPPWRQDNVNRTTFVPVVAQESAGATFVEFGYEEFGRPDQFFCTARAEKCRVATLAINEQTPFFFEHEAIVTAGPGSRIAIPALPGRILYYRVVRGGVTGPLTAVPVP